MNTAIGTTNEFHRWAMELPAIFDAVSEPILIADKFGTITYVNSAFSTFTGIPALTRLGSNIFVTTPDCGLAECLRTKQPIFNYKTTLPENNISVLANAVPITDGNELIGALVCYHFCDLPNHQFNEERLEQLTKRIAMLTKSHGSFEAIVGNDSTFRSLVNSAKNLATKNINILLAGEWGTGKELLAHAIHHASARASCPIFVVHCANFTDVSLETELFGSINSQNHGQTEHLPGKLELSSGGTLILKEVGSMDLANQDKLNTFLKKGQILTNGQLNEISLDVRIIATTSIDLRKLVATHQFREDLYYRLATTELTLTPLRERIDDFDLYLNLFLTRICKKFARPIPEIRADFKNSLKRYHWPGNLNELNSVLNRAILTSNGEVSDNSVLTQFSEARRDSSDNQGDRLVTFEEMEYHLLKQALKRFGNSVEGKKQAAKALNISLATLYNKLKKYGLKQL